MPTADRYTKMIAKKDVEYLPDKPGVYLFKNKSSQILYIGKAKSLKERVRSYTYQNYRHSRRTRRLIRSAKLVDYILCGSELEALLLESRLIKEHLPEFNIAQRRYRNFPFIKITLNEKFPRVFVMWEIELDGAKYIGPYPRWDYAEETAEIIHKLFPIRQCEGNIGPGFRRPPCLNYDIKRCSGPCMGKISEKNYRNMIYSVITLLSGEKDKLISNLESVMKQYSSDLQFEKAAIIRDRLRTIKEAIFRRQFQVNAVDNNNLIAVYPSKDSGTAELFFISKGTLAGQKSIGFRDCSDNDLLGSISADIEYYFQATPESKEISRADVDAMNIISRWLYRHRKDQSFVHIKDGKSIISTAYEVKDIIRLLDSSKSDS